MEFTGTIKVIMDEQKITDKFKKREFALSDNAPSYPQTILFEMTNDRCSLLDNFQEGQEVKVDFQLRGREWKNPQGEIKYFNTLSAFRIFPTKAQGSTHPPASSAPANKEARKAPKGKSVEETIAPTDEDGLPF